MTPAIDFVRQHIKAMPGYEPVQPVDILFEELGLPAEALAKLDANENPYGPLPEVKEALAKLDTVHIYPDPESRCIRRLLAEYHQILEENIIVGAGSDELIDLIMRIAIDPGDVVLNCPPTFGMYSFDAALNQAKMVSVPRRADFSLDMAGILKAVEKQKPKLLILANPNNPDGGIISGKELKELLDLPLLLVMDEAYIQFCTDGKSVIQEVSSRQNLIVLRTFSKWAGLAGLRIGYGIFPKALVPVIMKAKQPYSVSAAAEQAAVVTMKNIAKTEVNINQIKDQRKLLFRELGQIPWLKAYPSQANFILCKVVGLDAQIVKQRLRERGILIRYFDKPGLSDHIRISIGTLEQVQKLIAVLKGIR